MAPSLTGKVCLVTGASAGIGRGIAVQLGESGATVYITGRNRANLDDCGKEIAARGGKPILVQMDHGNDDEVEALFELIKKDQNGQLDVLVNNAYAGVSFIGKNKGTKFHKCDPVETWDIINGVGLRNHYICTVLASRIMVNNNKGLIINISSPGGLKYLFNVAYGVGKAACDRMAADCAIELKSSGVTMVSLWPAPVQTAAVKKNMLGYTEEQKKMFTGCESEEFAGKTIRYLATDPNIMNKTGKILLTLEMAREYGYLDIDGGLPADYRQVNYWLDKYGYTWSAYLLPNFIKIPMMLFHMGSNKF